MSLAHREELKAAATIVAAKKAHDQATEAMKTERDIARIKLKKKFEKMKNLPPLLIFSSCTFGPEQEQELSTVFHGGSF